MQDLALAAVKTAEKLIPDRGAGRQKFDWVDKLLSKVPDLSTSTRGMIIEGACETMWAADDALKDKIKTESES